MSDHAHPAASDRNLLFALLALQKCYVGPATLLAVLQAWLSDSSQPVPALLAKRALLSDDQLRAIDMAVDDYLRGSAGPAPVGTPTLPTLTGPSSSAFAEAPTQEDLGADGPRPVQQPPLAPEPGCRYQKVRWHARGGLGEVFVARDAELHREVALKEIQERRASNLDSRARFLLEAEITGRLEHPGIVPVYGLGEYSDGRPYYAMRFVEGETLKQAIHRFHAADLPGGLPTPDAADPTPRDHGSGNPPSLGKPGLASTAPARDLMERRQALRQLLLHFNMACNAVAYAHARGVLHRDLKPDNIMLGRFGETLIVDWGLAKPGFGPNQRGGADPFHALLVPLAHGDQPATQFGYALGTPPYMSPEQAAGRNDNLGPATDVYSMGATLYEILTGTRPFVGGSQAEILARVKRGDFPRPRSVLPSLPIALEAICLRAMAFATEDRYASLLDLAADVDRWLADEPVSACADPWPVRVARWAKKRRTALVGAGVFLVSAVIALSISTLVVWAAQRETARQREIADTKRLEAEANLDTARGLGYHGFSLIEKARDAFTTSEQLLADRRNFLDSAVGLFRKLHFENTADVPLAANTAQVLRHTAHVFLLEGKGALANSLYDEAIAIQHSIASGPADPVSRKLVLAGLLRDQSQAQAFEGQLGAGESSLHKADAICLPIVRSIPQLVQARRTRASVLLDLAALTFQCGKIPQSELACQEAVDLLADLLKANGQPDKYDPLLLAASRNRWGMALRERGQYTAALAQHQAAIDQLQAMVNEQPKGILTPDPIFFLAQCKLEKGRTLAKMVGKLPQGEEALSQAIELWRALCDAFPRVPVYRERLAEACRVRGEFQLSAGNAAPSAADLEMARQLLEQLVNDPVRPQACFDELGKTWLALARLARKNQDNPLALQRLAKAVEFLEKAKARSPVDFWITSDLGAAKTELQKAD